jgi:hypothetical protein
LEKAQAMNASSELGKEAGELLKEL